MSLEDWVILYASVLLRKENERESSLRSETTDGPSQRKIAVS